MSRIGVPVHASNPLTLIQQPSTATSSTTLIPIGFTLAGKREAKIPTKFSRRWNGLTFRTVRSALCIHQRITTWEYSSSPVRPSLYCSKIRIRDTVSYLELVSFLFSERPTSTVPIDLHRSSAGFAIRNHANVMNVRQSKSSRSEEHT